MPSPFWAGESNPLLSCEVRYLYQSLFFNTFRICLDVYCHARKITSFFNISDPSKIWEIMILFALCPVPMREA